MCCLFLCLCLPNSCSFAPSFSLFFSCPWNKLRGRSGRLPPCRPAERARDSFPACPCQPRPALCLELTLLICGGGCACPSVSSSHRSISCRQSRSVAFSVPTDVTQATVWGAHSERGGLLGGGWHDRGRACRRQGTLGSVGAPGTTGPRKLWSYLLCIWVVIMGFGLGIQHQTPGR